MDSKEIAEEFRKVYAVRLLDELGPAEARLFVLENFTGKDQERLLGYLPRPLCTECSGNLVIDEQSLEYFCPIHG